MPTGSLTASGWGHGGGSRAWRGWLWASSSLGSGLCSWSEAYSMSIEAGPQQPCSSLHPFPSFPNVLQVQEKHQGPVHCAPNHVHQNPAYPLQAPHQVSRPHIPSRYPGWPAWGDTCLQGEQWPIMGPRLTQILPFASSFKFGRKIFYVNYLSELSEHVKLEQLGIPRQVLK